MKFRNLLVIIFMFSILGYSSAQKDSTSQLVVSLGPSHIARQDLIFSPFIHKDLSPLSVGVKYEWNKKLYHFLRLDYAGFSTSVEPPYDILVDGEAQTLFPHTFTFIGFDYAAGRWIGEDSKNPSLLGTSINMDVQAMNYQYGRSSFFGYYSTIGLGIWYKQYYQLADRHRLTAQVELPLVSWYSRSPYLVNDDEFIENIYSHNGFTTFFAYLGDGEIVTWNKLQTVNAGVDYQYALSGKWSIGAAWQFAFIHARDPDELTSIQHSLLATIGLRL